MSADGQIACLVLAVALARTVLAAPSDCPARGIGGHQGDYANCPDDTAESLKMAVEKGCHFVEFDVQRCKTGEFLVLHDHDLSLKTDLTGFVWQKTFDYIRSGHIVWNGKDYPDMKVATLEEALAVLPRENFLINLHCYGQEGDPVARDVALRVKELGRLDQCYIAAILPDLALAREAVPEIQTCNMTRPSGVSYYEPWTDAQNAQYLLSTVENGCQYLQLRQPWPRKFSDLAHALGVKVNLCSCDWQSNDPANLKHVMKDLAIDYVLTENLSPMVAKFGEIDFSNETQLQKEEDQMKVGKLMAMIASCAAMTSAAGDFLQQLGTVQKGDISNTDVYEPTQWQPTKVPTDGDSIQFAGYSSDKRFYLSEDHANNFAILYFKTGHSVASTADGSHLRFDTKGYSLLYPEALSAYSAQLLWQTYVPAGKSIPSADYGLMSLARPDKSSSTVAVVKMDDFAFHQYAYGDYATTVEFERGTFNAFDPEGTAETDSGSVYELQFATDAGVPGTFVFDPGVVFKVPRVEVVNNDYSTLVMNGSAFHVGGTFWHRGRAVATNGAEITIGHLGGTGKGEYTQNNGSFYLGGDETKLWTKGAFTLKRGAFTNDGASVVIGGNLRIDEDAIGAKFMQAGGSLTVTGQYDPNDVKAEFRIRGGTATFASSYGLYTHGGRIVVEGGTLSAMRMRWGSKASSELTEVIQTGGTFILDGNTRPGIWMGEEDQQPCHLSLLGGELRTPTVNGKKTIARGGTHKGSFLGNGGKLVATAASPRPASDDNAPFFGWIDEAKIGAKGFTLDSQSFAVNVEQDFADADGEAGVLVKDGSGTLSYSGVCDVSVLRVSGGTWKMATAASEVNSTLTLEPGATFSLVGAATEVTLRSLTANGAVLALDPGDEIAVDGAIDLSNVSVSWSAEPTELVPILRVKGELPAATKKAIRQMYLSGTPMDKHVEFDFSYDGASGETTVKAKVAANAPLTETAVWTGSGAWATADNWQGFVKPTETKTAVFGAAGGKSVSVSDDDTAGALAFSGDGYRFAGGALQLVGTEGAAAIAVTEGSHVLDCGLDLIAGVPVSLAAGTALALNGTVTGGGLVKTGTGHLTLGGTLATQRGLVSESGLVTATAATALGATSDDSATLKGGTLEVAASNGAAMTVPARVTGSAADAQKAIVYKTDTDVTFERFDTTKGFTVKHGKGTMAIAVPAETTVALTHEGSMTIGQKDMHEASEGIQFPTDGTEPTGMRGPLSIVEGELRIVGLGDLAKVDCPAAAFVTVPTPGTIGAEPSLTLDNVTMTCGELYNGWCLGRAVFAAKNSTIRVLNGSTLSWTSSMPGYACIVDGCHAVYAATNSVMDYKSDNGYLTRGRVDSGSTDPIVRFLLNDAKFHIGTSSTLDGSVYMDLDNGSYFGRSAEATPTTSFAYGTAARVYGEIFTHNGSKLALKPVSGVVGQTRDLTLAFDDGEWQWADDSGSATIAPAASGHVRYEMRGRGAILRPAVEKTLTVNAAFEGEGGLVVDGPGTVAFGANAYAFNGTADVRQGILDLAAAGALADKAFSGDGTVANGALSNVKIAAKLSDDWTNTNGVPVFANCVLSGRVTVMSGRSDDDALELPDVKTPTAIAKVAGSTAVDLRQWKLTKTGIRKASGSFTQVGDTIYMTPAPPPGLVVMVK